ncbi:arylsulfatase [Cyclobacterium qasimii]|uniref:Arylsulfatase n=2 Tax=Cyclobacterium qasimii TaxID=1350429 RepID=S7VFC1_9BACT|nr:arylsulfatase [Cyclobacterium qasimii]EPR68217.1 Arylsulfatase [Cyclobacterium qasimii M12-11B]GEO19795.1 arylsulfatase [Cyclobacterium qasimii]
MNKFTLFLSFGFTGMLLAGCGQQQQNTTSSESSEAKPNIIYILADDLGYGDLGFNGQEYIATPNIDKLAKEGLFFNQHYSGSTVCAPSRSTLVSGLHTGNAPVRGNYEIQPEGQFPLPDSVFTIFESLKAAGYTTGAFGKWGLGYPSSEGDPNNQGVDVFFGYNCQRMGHNYYPFHLWDNQDSLVLEGNAGTNLGDYGPALIHEKTLDFITDNSKNPFFLYVPTIIPHAELIVPEDIMVNYRGRFEETPYKGVDEGKDYKIGGYMSQEEPRAAFVAMVELLDKQVGEIVAKLEELGIRDNTMIIFTSDNGPHKEGGADPDFFNSNGPWRGYKRDLYEGGIRVPMIANWPGKIAPGQTDHISAFWDIYPTVAALTGSELPENTDGISFAPVLIGNKEDQKSHEYLYWEFIEQGGKQAIRKGNWKAIRLNLRKEDNPAIELYNLEEDPAEENNIADKHPDLVKSFKALMEANHTPNPVFKLYASELNK